MEEMRVSGPPLINTHTHIQTYTNRRARVFVRTPPHTHTNARHQEQHSPVQSVWTNTHLHTESIGDITMGLCRVTKPSKLPFLLIKQARRGTSCHRHDGQCQDQGQDINREHAISTGIRNNPALTQNTAISKN